MRLIRSKIVFLLLCIIALGCKKDVPPQMEEQTEENSILTLSSNSYNQLQLISIEKSGVSHSSNYYSGTVGNDSVMVTVNDSLISFIAPFTPQLNVSLTVTIDGIEYRSTNFNVNELTISQSPEVVLNELVSLRNDIVNNTNILLDSMGNYSATFNTSSYNADQVVMDDHWNIVNSNFQSLNSTERNYVATFIKSNEQIFKDCADAVEAFSKEIPQYLPKSLSMDLEELNKTKAENMVLATYKVSKLIGVAVASGFFTSVVLTPIAGTITAGIILGWNGDVFRSMVAAYDIFKASAVTVVIDELSMTKAEIFFENNTTHPLVIKSNYRSLHNQTDFSSPFMTNVKSALDFISENYQRVSNYFSFNTPVESIENITSYDTYNLDIHARYLTISDINNSNVELLSQANNEGTLDVKFKNNLPGTVQEFTFKVTYENDFGTGSKTIDASMGAPPLSWTTLPYSTPAGSSPCDGTLYWGWIGGAPPYEKIMSGNGDTWTMAEEMPNSGGPYLMGLCPGETYTMTVIDALNDTISHSFVPPYL